MLKIKDNLKNQLLLASCVNRISLFGALCALLSAVNATVFELDNFKTAWKLKFDSILF